tara:strand:+ start:456 stop:653 length:198 start_codon:yes stop_codon:yes gene_type:complete
MVKSQIIIGIISIFFGLALLFVPVAGLIYGPILIVIGISLIVFRNKEAEMEKIKQGGKNDSNINK